MKSTIVRLTALFLALSMCLGLLGLQVRATGEDSSLQSDPAVSSTAPGADPVASSGDNSGDASGDASGSGSGDSSGGGSGDSSGNGSGDSSGSGSGDSSGSGSGDSSGGSSGDASGSGQETTGDDTPEEKTTQQPKTLEEEETAEVKTDQEEAKPAAVKPQEPDAPSSSSSTASNDEVKTMEDRLLELEQMAQCGPDLNWALGGTTLTISGTGSMWNYDGSDREHMVAPWDEGASYVKKIIIGAEVTSLGEAAFQSCVNLEEVEFQSPLTTYPGSAFRYTPWWRLQQFRKAADINPGESLKLNPQSAEEVLVYSFAPTATEQYRIAVTGSKGAKATVSLYDESGAVLFRPRHSQRVTLERVMGNGDRVFLLIEPDSELAGSDKYTLTVDSGEPQPLNGTCGSGLTWVLDPAEELLTISGSGEMDEFKDRSTIPWRAYSALISTLRVESGVTSVGRNAFEDCPCLHTVVLSGTVKRIGSSAFAGCAALESVTMDPETRFSERTFAGTPWLWTRRLNEAAALLPETDTRVQVGKDNKPVCFRFKVPADGSYRLEAAQSATKDSPPLMQVSRQSGLVGDGEAVQFTACKDETLLLSVSAASKPKKDVSWTVRLRPLPAREQVNGLRWSLDRHGILTVSGSGALEPDEEGYPWEDRRGEITGVVLEEGVTSVGADAFGYCFSLSSVTLPDSVQTIGDRAFCNCPYLTTLELGSALKQVGACAFNSCCGLFDLSLPDSVEQLGEYAFAECSNLQTVNLKDTLRWSENVFAETPWLRVKRNWAVAQALQPGVEKTVILNKGKPRMYFTFTPLEDGFYVFSSTSTQDSGDPLGILYTEDGVVLAEDNNSGEDLDFLLGYNLRKEITYYYCAACSTDPKGKQAYSYDVGLQQYPVPVSGTCGSRMSWEVRDGVLTINGTGLMYNFASAAAVPWQPLADQITSLQVNEGVGTIGTFAFEGLTKLVRAELPGGLISVGSRAFAGCGALKELTLPDTIRHFGGDVFTRTDKDFLIHALSGSAAHIYARENGILWEPSAAPKQ